MHTRRTIFALGFAPGLALAALPLLLSPLGCASQLDDASDPIEAREGEAPTEARRIELTVPAEHASREQVQALVDHLEGQAELAGAKVSVNKSSETGDAQVDVMLWGQDMPSDEAFEADLLAEFPYLAADSIAISAVDIEAESLPHEDAPEDPDELRQRVIDDLRAKGVEGEIDVTITDHPDGRREVEVEVHDDQDEPS